MRTVMTFLPLLVSLLFLVYLIEARKTSVEKRNSLRIVGIRLRGVLRRMT
jgi:hypothetical protein